MVTFYNKITLLIMLRRVIVDLDPEEKRFAGSANDEKEHLPAARTSSTRVAASSSSSRSTASSASSCLSGSSVMVLRVVLNVPNF